MVDDFSHFLVKEIRSFSVTFIYILYVVSYILQKDKEDGQVRLHNNFN